MTTTKNFSSVEICIRFIGVVLSLSQFHTVREIEDLDTSLVTPPPKIAPK